MYNRVLRGIVRGNIIELDDDPRVADGTKVEVTIRLKGLPGPPPGWQPGSTKTAAGMLAEYWTEEDDQILQEIYLDRKREGQRAPTE
jgi:hypothetical protein